VGAKPSQGVDQVTKEDMDAKETHAQALKLFRDGSVAESASILEKLRGELIAQQDEGQAAEVGNDLGVAYYRLGRLDAARDAFEQSRSAFEKLGNGSGHARALGNIAQAQSRGGDKAAAEKNYARAAELFHDAGEKQFGFDTYRALSQMQMQRGRWLESLATYDHALAAKGGSGVFRWFLQIPLRLMGMK